MSWYSGDSTYDTVLTLGLISIPIIGLISAFVIAPYGRFSSKKFGASMDPRLGWFLMELPATVSFIVVFALGDRSTELVPLVFLGVWLVHYGNRGFLFPALMRVPPGKRQSFTFFVVVTGWIVTTVHGYLNAAWISDFAGYDASWLGDPRFIIGIMLYFAMLAGNVHADAVLRKLRTKEEVRSGEAPYRIPRGGLYEYVTCPSYLFELLAWTGFALATWSLGSLFVLGVSAANLVPRALATHRWYHERFEDYPKERRALIPFLL